MDVQSDESEKEEVTGCNISVVCLSVRDCGITEAITFVNLLSVNCHDWFICFVIHAILIQI